jgi:hypothetical protein
MEWDLGLQGLGVLALLSLGVGLAAQGIAARYTTRWIGVIAATAYFVVGLLISEVWFGWATEEELQPNIDGLSFDEVLLGVVPAIGLALIARRAGRRRRQDPRALHAEAARGSVRRSRSRVC